jgi:predicted permease
MRHHFRSVLRRLLVRPWLPVVSIALLGTAIGFHTAIFAAVDIVLLRPLPFHDPDRIVVINEVKRTGEPAEPASTTGNYRDFTQLSGPSGPFAALGAYASTDPALFTGEAPHAIEVFRVTSSLFQVLGTPLARGRLFTPEEEDAGADVVILTDSAWTRYFGRSEQVVGSRIDLDGFPYTVIGIAPPAAGRLLHADILRPLARPQSGRGPRVVRVVGRLAEGMTIAAARDIVGRRIASLESVARENEGYRAASLVPLRDRLVSSIRGPILALEILSLFIIVVVAANLIGLQFARLEARAREMAIRAALGASRRRLIADALIESLAIAGAALAIGWMMAHWMLAIGKATLIEPGVLQPLQLDLRALASGAIVASIVGLGTGMCSVLMLLTRDISQLLIRASTAIGPGRLTQRAQALVVVTQTALALIFIVVAFTLVGDVARLMRIDPGFRTDALWTVDIKTRGGPRVETTLQGRQYAQILDALRALPGVQAAAAINSFPLIGPGLTQSLRLRDTTLPAGERVQFRLVMPGYFETMGIRLRAGRAFTVSDDRSNFPASFVAVVNQAFADRHWPGAATDSANHAIGREIGIATSPWIRVIGVADNVRSVDLTTPPMPEVYLTSMQVSSTGEMTFVLRTQQASAGVGGGAAAPVTAAAIRNAIEHVAPGLALTRMGTVDMLLTDQRKPQRFGAAFLSMLALLAMGLAAAGTYSLVSYAVSSRNREMAIRRVLGAADGQITWRMTSRAATFIGLGIACGVVAIVTLSRIYNSVLFNGHIIDPATVAIAAIVLIALSVLASYVPVRRAMHRPLREVLQAD